MAWLVGRQSSASRWGSRAAFGHDSRRIARGFVRDLSRPYFHSSSIFEGACPARSGCQIPDDHFGDGSDLHSRQAEYLELWADQFRNRFVRLLSRWTGFGNGLRMGAAPIAQTSKPALRALYPGQAA